MPDETIYYQRTAALVDPISQGVLGAAFAQTNSKHAQLGKAAIIGALSGMAPDLDIFIRSASDPLLALEFHRHFTHSLLFIPIGGLLCGLIGYYLLGKRWGLSMGQTILWATIGYATHGLLDGCTSYGTQLLWPLSGRRFAIDIVSVIDPLFTLPLLIMVVLAVRRKNKKYLAWAMAWGSAYLGIGFLQHERAVSMGYEIAQQRGHEVMRLEVKPSFGNLLVWKVIYETENKYYVDAVKPGLVSSVVWSGDSIDKLDLQRDFPWLDEHSQQARDIERFRKFSAGFIAIAPEDTTRIIDIRYSMLPQQIAPLWGIKLFPAADESVHVEYYTQRREGGISLNRLMEMIRE